MSNPVIIGLTGQTGSGKSTVGKMLCYVGFFYIDCDEVARLATKKGSPVLSQLADEFGSDVLNDDGELQRKVLAKKAFSSKEQTQKLNNITHPYITNMVNEQISDAKLNGFNSVVLDAPQLFESGLEKRCDIVVSVVANKESRLKRIIERDKLDERSANLRINAQLDETYYKDHSNIIITNNSDLASLKEQVKNLLNYIEEKRNEEIS